VLCYYLHAASYNRSLDSSRVSLLLLVCLPSMSHLQHATLVLYNRFWSMCCGPLLSLPSALSNMKSLE
jgi:hypothetical protein